MPHTKEKEFTHPHLQLPPTNRQLPPTSALRKGGTQKFNNVLKSAHKILQIGILTEVKPLIMNIILNFVFVALWWPSHSYDGC
jgi:hypothetical protein